MIKYPEIIVKKGFGEFQHSSNSYEASFEIFNYPQGNLIITKSQVLPDNVSLFTNTGNWSLYGSLNDGTTVQSQDLVMNEFDSDSFIFQATKEIYFGNRDIKIHQAKYPITGLYKGAIEFKTKEWVIKSKAPPEHELKALKRVRKVWRNQPETRLLEISSSANVGINEYLKKAIVVSELLTLVCGNQANFHRQLYYSEDKKNLEVWRKRVDYNFGIDSIVDSLRISEFLNQTIHNYENLTTNEKSTINRAVDYLNSSAHGFIEDRLFRVMLAWELTAHEYCSDSDLDKELIQLKKQLKETVKNWSKEFPERNKNGFITTRVVGSLEWEKLINKLIKLAESESLHLEKIGIDFRRLKELRDNVAHTGKFNDKHDSVKLFGLLDKAILGLRILILRKVGYTGEIQIPNNNFLVRKGIMEFIIK
jgi:hypothetical protein